MHAPVRSEMLSSGSLCDRAGVASSCSAAAAVRGGRGAAWAAGTTARPGVRGWAAAAADARAARSGVSLGSSSLKCSASHSLTPASLPRRAAAAAGALPFLVAHTRPPLSSPLLSLSSPSFPAAASAPRRPRPSGPGRTHHTTTAPRVLLPAPSRAAMTSVLRGCATPLLRPFSTRLGDQGRSSMGDLGTHRDTEHGPGQV